MQALLLILQAAYLLTVLLEKASEFVGWFRQWLSRKT